MLSGRRAVVTGAASGIGKSVAGVLSRHGARVCLVDINGGAAHDAADELNAVGSFTEHVWAHLDVANASQVHAFFSSGPFDGDCADVVVNAAGITADSLLLKQSEVDFDRVINVNLKGTFNVNQSFAKALVSQQQLDGKAHGSVINVSSINGKCGSVGQCNYAAAKSGVIGLTKSAAKELARHSIRVNAILPGFIDTPMVATVPEKVFNGIVATIPARRLGKPEEIGEVAAFLASDRSSYVTGAAIEVTGGLHM